VDQSVWKDQIKKKRKGVKIEQRKEKNRWRTMLAPRERQERRLAKTTKGNRQKKDKNSPEKKERN